MYEARGDAVMEKLNFLWPDDEPTSIVAIVFMEPRTEDPYVIHQGALIIDEALPLDQKLAIIKNTMEILGSGREESYTAVN